MSDGKQQFSIDNRVKISESYHWAKGVLGTIKEPPPEVKLLSEGWKGCNREVTSINGKLTFYWVEFDEPQNDANGDGNYFAGEIASKFLTQC